jgi:hypothetical protein
MQSYRAVLLTASARGAPKTGLNAGASTSNGAGSASTGFFFFFFSFHCLTTSAAVKSLDFFSFSLSLSSFFSLGSLGPFSFSLGSLGPFSFTLKSFSFFLEKLGFLKTWMPLERFILEGLSASSAELSSWKAA